MLNPYQVKFLEVFFQSAFSHDGFFKKTNKILTADQESPISSSPLSNKYTGAPEVSTGKLPLEK